MFLDDIIDHFKEHTLREIAQEIDEIYPQLSSRCVRSLAEAIDDLINEMIIDSDTYWNI